MTSVKALNLTFVVGRTTHPQSVIDDLWNRALGASEATPVEGTAKKDQKETKEGSK